MEKEYAIGYQVKKLNNMLERRLIQETKKDNNVIITITQIKIIKYLFFNEDKIICQKDIESELGLRSSTASGILDTMEKNKIVIRLKSKEDARKKEVKLSDDGIKKLNEMKNKVLDFENELRKNISKEELEIFFEVIDKIKSNINKEGIC